MRSLEVGRHRALPGDWYGTPKEIWGFRSPRVRGSSLAIARRFLADNSALFELEGIRGRLEHVRTIHSVGATHVLFRQRHARRSIHRAYVTVHIGSDHRVYLAKNRAVPRQYLNANATFTVGRAAARRLARRAVRSRHGRAHVVGRVEEVWFPLRRQIRPAYKMRLHSVRPRAEWIVFVDADTRRILSRYDNLATAPAGLASVFDPNPVAAVTDWRVLRGSHDGVRTPPASAYRLVALEGLKGNRRLDGVRVTTRPTPDAVRRADHRFVFTSDEPGFAEAMVYHHVDTAIRYLESLGYCGPRRIFRTPLPVNARGTRDDNSWYSPGTRSLTFGTGGVDDAADGEVILHEFGHAIQDAICPDFGQSPEAAAMGEGFGDYFAGSTFAETKPPALRSGVMAWDALPWSSADPPVERRLDDPRTYASFHRRGDEHRNGTIWSATLWDIRAALGRVTADRIIVESHFQLDGFTTFARGARAILDADRNLHAGRHARPVRAIFRRRRIGPL